jgi:hypothetical protein
VAVGEGGGGGGATGVSVAPGGGGGGGSQPVAIQTHPPMIKIVTRARRPNFSFRILISFRASPSCLVDSYPWIILSLSSALDFNLGSRARSIHFPHASAAVAQLVCRS